VKFLAGITVEHISHKLNNITLFLRCTNASLSVILSRLYKGTDMKLLSVEKLQSLLKTCTLHGKSQYTVRATFICMTGHCMMLSVP
jgi:hypothetical protein